ncbi:MAG: hypothetical protein U0942_04485 [Parvibaculum sp.]|jgi:hypothetical protein|uniref:hypothetical protein n=1 Tax=Parvibaculum sp. TaxID=2024848 RepID=UPI000CB81167|nr:hypothetical protein [Parvibaculum sp.]MDZ4380579.1 hypothetical protein [Parvibaculum sp.]PKP77543.1 MAG: hypothetical protein CVT81_09025 [Alphaproteobacteria bacterium HGW-Alphaproteobacteria-3]
MKKFVLAVAVSSFAFAGAALANVGAGLVGNTVTLTYADGSQAKIYYPDASSIVVKGADGSESQGTWHVSDNKICTKVGDAPENCTDPVTEAPAVGSSGTIESERGQTQWAVSAGKDF